MNVVVEYLRAGTGRWQLVIAAHGETPEELEVSLRGMFEDLVGVRPREELTEKQGTADGSDTNADG